MTNLERKRRHLSDNAICPRCGVVDESVLHVIRDCQFAAKVWDELQFSQSDTIRLGNRVDYWIKGAMTHDKSTEIGILCWYLWKERNELIFNGRVQPADSLARKITSWTTTVMTTLQSVRTMGDVQQRRRLVDVAWEPGPPDWVVLNTDGSVMLNTSNAAAGGLLRTDMGRCIAAFSTNLGRCSITRAELRGIIGGLNLAWDVGARRVMVQVDSRAAVSLISNASNPCHQHAGEVTLIHQLLNREWEVTISHIYREGNQAADYLADIGHGLPTGTHSINVLDSTLCYFLRRDCMGISEPRLITD
ncbi:Putative ribonuclease H protein At1g65750 [Linum perenne]